MSECVKKCLVFLVLLLNICTGGLGTIISPFIFKENCNSRKIIIGIIVGCVQILHFVHLLSSVIGFKFITNFYDIIGGENILTPIMSDKYKNFQNMKKNISESLHQKIPDIDNNEDENTFGMFTINPGDIIEMKFRVSFVKIILQVISGFSFVNSCLSPLINLIKDNKIDLKMFTYGIFNPGEGVLISAILLFNGEYCKLIISLIGLLIGILLMLSPYILGVGLYLMKIVYNILNLFIIKLFITYFGTIGVLYSMIFSFLQKDKKESSLIELDQKGDVLKGMLFDIDCKFGSIHYKLKSEFGVAGILRVIANTLIPGSGIFSLLCKYDFIVAIFFVGMIQLMEAILFIFIFAFFYLIENNDKDDIDYDQKDFESRISLIYGFLTAFLLIHLCGTLIIIIADYFPKKPNTYDGLGAFALTIINILSGVFGFIIYIHFSTICIERGWSCVFLTFVWPIIGIVLYHLFIINIFTDNNKIIIFFALYCIYSVISIIFICKGKKNVTATVFNQNNNVESDQVNIYNNNNNQNNDNNNNILLYRIRNNQVPPSNHI